MTPENFSPNFIVTILTISSRESSIINLPLLRPGETYGLAYYLDQLHRAAATVLDMLLGPRNFADPNEKAIPRRARKSVLPDLPIIQRTFL